MHKRFLGSLTSIEVPFLKIPDESDPLHSFFIVIFSFNERGNFFLGKLLYLFSGGFLWFGWKSGAVGAEVSGFSAAEA